jgi:hypothetical protein
VTKLFFLLTIPCLTGAAYIGANRVVYTETQPATRVLPIDGGEGINLNQIISLHGLVQCSDGSLITAGVENSFYRTPGSGAWMPGATSNNFTIPTGNDAGLGPELIVSNPWGRFLYQSVGVVCSGGSWDGGVIVTIEANQQ